MPVSLYIETSCNAQIVLSLFMEDFFSEFQLSHLKKGIIELEKVHIFHSHSLLEKLGIA